MGQITINNNGYVGESISIINGKVFVDGKDMTPDSKEITITVEGDVNTLKVDYCKSLSIKGSVNNAMASSGNIDITGDVKESVSTSSGNIHCGNVGTSVRTSSGSVMCGDVTGSVMTTSGDIKNKK